MKLLSLAVALLRRGRAASSPPFLVRTVHSKSVVPRGRAGIRVSQGRRKRRTTSKILKSLAGKRKWPYHGEGGAAAAAVDTQEQQLRKAAAEWPSWLPKPMAYIAAERRQKIEEEQEQTRKAAQNHSKPPTVEAVFIPKSSPEHSSRRKPAGENDSASSAWFRGKRRDFSTCNTISTTKVQPREQSHLQLQRPQKQQEWPRWLPPRPHPMPPHPISQAVRQGYWRVRTEGFQTLFKDAKLICAVLLIAVTIGGTSTYYLAHLETVPFTGRKRFTSISDAKIEEVAQQTLRGLAFKYKGKILPRDHPFSRRAISIANRVLLAARDLDGLDFKNVKAGSTASDASSGNKTTGSSYTRDLVHSTKWDCVVVDDPSPNACMTPNGLIVVNSGLFHLMDAEVQVEGSHNFGSTEGADDRIATTIAHEVAHHLCQHIREKLSNDAFQRYVAYIFAAVGFPFLLGLPGLGHFAVALPNSRTCEHEADALGIKLMSRACFDPREASCFWERMLWHTDRNRAAKRSGQTEYDFHNDRDGGVFGQEGASSFLSTHPSSPERMQRLQDSLPAALAIRNGKGCPDLKEVSDFRRAAVKTA